MNLNDFGKIVDAEWQNLMFKYKNVKLGEYIVMPNHFHGIIEITGRVETGRVEKGEGRADPAPTGGDIADTGGDIAGGDITGGDITVGNIIAYFKYMTTKKINLPVKLWQRNYYEHIIRNEIEYANIEKYIRNNPIITYRRRIS
ncbi:MAG: hypothetical protein LBQ87_04610 [Candidatus Fibromonas sp.]|nr:hypothetical protein [Candidatus Fibromonas sp.]